MTEDKKKKSNKEDDSKKETKSKNSDKDKDFFIGKLKLGTAAVVRPKKKLEEVIAKEFLEDVFDKKKIEEFEEFQQLGAEEVYVPEARDSYDEEKREGEKFGSNVYEEKNKDTYSETNLKNKDSRERIIDIRNLKEGKDEAMFGLDSSSQFRKNSRSSNTLN